MKEESIVQNLSIDFETFVITRIDKHLDNFKHSNREYRELCNKLTSLLAEFENIQACDPKVYVHIQELLQAQFVIQGRAETHIYSQGFADGIRVIQLLNRTEL